MFPVDAGKSMDDGYKVGLNLKIVLCDVNGDDGVGSVRGNESFEEDPVFLP